MTAEVWAISGVFGDPEKAGAKLNVSNLAVIQRAATASDRSDLKPPWLTASGQTAILLHSGGDRLYVIECDGRPMVRLLNNATMTLRVRPGSDRDTREAVLHRWYRGQLRGRLPAPLAKWEPKVGVRVGEVRIKKMKTRWGSCNKNARRIWLNLELAKKQASCLKYIVVHEMVHLIERSHNDRFWDLMDSHMPQWRLHRDDLNRAPLSHEDWRY